MGPQVHALTDAHDRDPAPTGPRGAERVTPTSDALGTIRRERR